MAYFLDPAKLPLDEGSITLLSDSRISDVADNNTPKRQNEDGKIELL